MGSSVNRENRLYMEALGPRVEWCLTLPGPNFDLIFGPIHYLRRSKRPFAATLAGCPGGDLDKGDGR